MLKIVDILKNEIPEDKKIIIFSMFTSALDLLNETNLTFLSVLNKFNSLFLSLVAPSS
jgi:hypothetical protein